MRRAARSAAVAVAALALFVGAAVVYPRGAEAPSATDAQAPTSTLLHPALPVDSLEGTILALRTRLRAIPQDRRSYASLGLAYVAEASVTADPTWYRKAEGVLRRAVSLGGREDAETLLGEGALALARHDFARALDRGHAARAIDPFDADVYGVIGDALLELGRYDRAFDAFQTMVDTRPGLASYARASYARELMGDVSGAIAAMEQAYDAAGNPAEAAWAASQLGDLAFGRGDVVGASDWFERGLQVDPSSAPNQAGLAEVAWARGQTWLAIERYRAVVERYPAVEYLTALGDLYASAGREDLAAEQYAVVEATREIARTNGVNVDLELALFDADHGDPRDALVAARAEWARRTSVHVADAYAWALYANGRYAGAARLSERARRLGTRSALFLFHAGMIERARGHEDAARRLLSRAIAINPNFSIQHRADARRALDGLEAGR